MRKSLSDFEDETISEIEITPLVAVSLVLVMVFMVTAPLFMQPVMKVVLPKATTGKAEERENITISISKDGLWAINENEYAFEKIPFFLRQKIEKTRDKFVIIRADEQAIHKWLLQAMSISKECGAKTVTIAVKQKRK